ncbi:ABC transporter ATP-binding protein [Luminiphilus sp.]|nr:ABC transporter ATP-binding protein [Luminiphilus sp.]MDB2511895.1 ABC transporter ATP-binding protein [Luminiphilus sp.]MDB2629631.1 ABC transporter ATP-binding protein [Luminiphilus sp.]
MVILSARAVTKTYLASAGPVSVLSDLDFELASGDRVAIVGTSGAGKSTLLNILGGLDTPSAGVVHLGTKELTSLNETELCQWRNQNLGFVFQFHHLMPEFTALEAVAMPARIGGISQREASTSAEALLVRLGLADRMHHRPSQLSGGERQRVAIARALVNRPLCVLMDEPTGNLDPHTAESVMALTRELDFQSTALVVVTHDPHVAERMDRQYRLSGGKLSLTA